MSYFHYILNHVWKQKSRNTLSKSKTNTTSNPTLSQIEMGSYLRIWNPSTTVDGIMCTAGRCGENNKEQKHCIESIEFNTSPMFYGFVCCCRCSGGSSSSSRRSVVVVVVVVVVAAVVVGVAVAVAVAASAAAAVVDSVVVVDPPWDLCDYVHHVSRLGWDCAICAGIMKSFSQSNMYIHSYSKVETLPFNQEETPALYRLTGVMFQWTIPGIAHPPDPRCVGKQATHAKQWNKVPIRSCIPQGPGSAWLEDLFHWFEIL